MLVATACAGSSPDERSDIREEALAPLEQHRTPLRERAGSVRLRRSFRARWLWCAWTAGSSLACAWHSSGPSEQTVPAAITKLAPPDMGFRASELLDDSIVRVVVGEVACTGTLIAPNQVLTAHHCLAERGPSGEYFERDVHPRQIRVELGGDFLPWGEVSVRTIVAPNCGYAAGEGDVAILILDEPLRAVDIKAVGLDDPVQPSASVEPVGFGRCADSPDGVRRHTRPGGAIGQVYTRRFRAPAAICPGDSGGPALNEAGRVIGVISASAMDGRQSTLDLTEFTRVDGWRELFAVATSVAAGVSLSELPPVTCPAVSEQNDP